jgi:putative transposase
MREQKLQAEMIAVHRRARQTFRPEHLQRELIKSKVDIGVRSIKRIRKHLGLRCKPKNSRQRPTRGTTCPLHRTC